MEPRFYREWTHTSDLVSFVVQVRETDLQVQAQRDLSERTVKTVRRLRGELERYISVVGDFADSFSPLPDDPDAPIIVRSMLEAGLAYGVGPMAAVAGAVAEGVGRDLLEVSPDVIVENGGDIFLKMSRPVKLGLYAGEHSPFSRKVVIRLDCAGGSRGVCTSSGTVGPSVSFGKADAVVTVAESTALADAAATAIANEICSAEDLQRVLEVEQARGKLLGCLAVIGEHLGAYGDIDIVD